MNSCYIVNSCFTMNLYRLTKSYYTMNKTFMSKHEEESPKNKKKNNNNNFQTLWTASCVSRSKTRFELIWTNSCGLLSSANNTSELMKFEMSMLRFSTVISMNLLGSFFTKGLKMKLFVQQFFGIWLNKFFTATHIFCLRYKAGAKWMSFRE